MNKPVKRKSPIPKVLSSFSHEDSRKFQADKSQLLGIFSDLVWTKIFTNLTTPKDIGNATNASLYFLERFFHKRKIHVLLPQAFGILLPFWEKQGEYETEELMKIDSTKHLVPWYYKVLKARLVCQDWCKTIDNFYQNLPHHYRLDGDARLVNPDQDDENIILGEWALDKVSFSEEESRLIRKFLKHFKKSHDSKPRNPFPCRSAVLSISHLDETQANSWNVNKLLGKYGQFLWYCVIISTDTFPSYAAFYKRIVQLLNLLPNLRVLEIQCYHHGQYELGQGRNSARQFVTRVTPDEELHLNRAMAEMCLPKLKKLRYFKSAHLPTSMFNHFISTNSHLKMLQIERQDIHNNYDIHTQPLSNLTALNMEYYSKEDFYRVQNPVVNWPLTKLYLDFDKCEYFLWSDLFSTLGEKFADTLIELGLGLPKTKVGSEEMQIIRECSRYSLNLPNVKRLKLVVCNFTSLDFILPMQDSLEILEIVIRLKFHVWQKTQLGQMLVEEQQIEFLGFIGTTMKLMKSNIWQLFPKLKEYRVLESYDKLTGRPVYPDLEDSVPEEHFCSGTRLQLNNRENWVEHAHVVENLELMIKKLKQLQTA